MDQLQRILKTVLKRKALSLLEAVMMDNHEAYFHLLMVNEPNGGEVDEFNNHVTAWQELEHVSPTQTEDHIDELAKAVLQNKKLNEEICKLVIYLTSKNFN